MVGSKGSGPGILYIGGSGCKDSGVVHLELLEHIHSEI